MVKILMFSHNYSQKKIQKQNMIGTNIIKIFIKLDLTQDTLLLVINNVHLYNLQTNM